MNSHRHVPIVVRIGIDKGLLMAVALKRPTVTQGFVVKGYYCFVLTVLTLQVLVLGPPFIFQQPLQQEISSFETAVVSSVQSDNVLPKDLPVRNENGVVVVFIHIGKTGGSTIGNHLTQATDHYHKGWTSWGYRRARRGLETALTNWTKGDSHTLELHSADAPPYLTILPTIDSWRQRCKELDVPFFAFTVLRNPSKLAMSFFNFYHGGYHRKFKHFKTATEAQFLNHTIDNPQCMFLSRGETAYHPGNEHLRQNLTKSECNSVYDALAKHLDWIGTTETLASMTLPILERVTNTTLEKGKIVNAVKAEEKNILWSNLTEEGKQTVLDMTAHDLDMWNRCQAEYKLSMWTDFSYL
jgi:hypothetical protein